jgi:hypothetical protein
MRPILLEIVTRVMTFYDPCHRCAILFDEAGLQKELTQKTMGDYPQDLRKEFIDLSDWIRELTRLYKHRLRIRLIDAQSPLGMYKSLRHWIRNYPAFIVERKEKFVGWDKDRLEDLLDDYIQSSIQSRKRQVQSTFP